MSIACNGILLQFLNKFSIGIQKKGKKTRWNTERYCEWHLLQQFQYFRWISEILLRKYARLVYCMSWIIIIFPNKIRNLCFMCLVRVQYDTTRHDTICFCLHSIPMGRKRNLFGMPQDATWALASNVSSNLVKWAFYSLLSLQSVCSLCQRISINAGILYYMMRHPEIKM